MNTISTLNAPAQRMSARPQAAAVAAEPQDRVELSSGGPRLMAGVPTGFLSPQIPPPSIYTSYVGLEIVPGLGISVDGKALLVGQKGTSENLEIIGHLPGQPGSGSPILYPQRDFKVSHNGDNTRVDGHFGWQDYSLSRSGNQVSVTGETDRDCFVTTERADGFDVQSKYAGRTWHVTTNGNTASVTDGTDQRFTITQNGNQTVVDSGRPETSFTFTRGDNGVITVDGQLKPQDFTIGNSAEGLVVQGHYPHQKFVVKAAA